MQDARVESPKGFPLVVVRVALLASRLEGHASEATIRERVRNDVSGYSSGGSEFHSTLLAFLRILMLPPLFIVQA